MSGAASFWWRLVFGRVTSRPSGHAMCCQVATSEVTKAEQTSWWRGEPGGKRPPGAITGNRWHLKGGANWTFWGEEMGQKISLRKTVSNKTSELQEGENL